MRLTIVTTGGTIAKTYDEAQQRLQNARPVVESIVAALRLPDIQVTYRHILSKDSLDLTDADRALILKTVRGAIDGSDAIVVVHGTDTLEITGEMLFNDIGESPIPIVLTGAMRPYEFRDSDAAYTRRPST